MSVMLRQRLLPTLHVLACVIMGFALAFAVPLAWDVAVGEAQHWRVWGWCAAFMCCGMFAIIYMNMKRPRLG